MAEPREFDRPDESGTRPGAPSHLSPTRTDGKFGDKLDRIAFRLARFPKSVAAACIVSALLVGIADYSLGIAVSMSVFYFVPVAVTAFVLGSVPGILTAAFVALVNMIADLLQFSSIPGIPASVAVWNSFSRLAINIVLAAVVAALRKRWHQEKLVARIDVTTGAANARALAERLEESLASARRNSFPVSVCLFDIDDFKAVNDLQGHAAGDRLLKDVVRAAQRALRPGDTVARWGGDEFVLVLPGADANDARVAVDRMVRTLEAASAESGVPVTLSVGVVTSPPTTLGGDHLLKRADELMYEAKRAGKNRIVAGGVSTRQPPEF